MHAPSLNGDTPAKREQSFEVKAYDVIPQSKLNQAADVPAADAVNLETPQSRGVVRPKRFGA
jgi:hypothetical protein